MNIATSRSVVAETSSAASSPPRVAAEDPALARACMEFESVLVRQLLSTMKTGAEGNAYGGMITDALAGAVAEGGGMGMADSIRRALGAHR